MRWTCLLVVTLAAPLGWASCRKDGNGSGSAAEKTRKTPAPRAPASAGQDVDAKGRYALRRTLPNRYDCRGHLDCVATRLRPGHCCLTECPESRVAGNRRWLAVLEEVHKRRCHAWLEANSHACTYPKCDPRGRPEARCEKGRCVVRYLP